MQRSDVYGRDFSTGLNRKYRRVYNLVPNNCRLLELGCSTGYFTEYLTKKGTTVIAADCDPSAVAACRERGINAFQIDLSTDEMDGVLAEHSPFDAVIAMDLLEHLPQPHDLLTRLHNLMHHSGRLFVTGPNVAYWHVRWELLRGRWNYTEAGIMDETHLRWFTRATWRKLLEESGFTIEIDDVAEFLLPKEHQLRKVLGGVALEKIKKFSERAFPGLVATIFLFCCRVR